MSMLTTALLEGLQNSDTPSPMIQGLKTYLTEVEDVMVRFRRETARLKASDEYNAIGVKNRTMEAAQAAADKLNGIEASAHGYDDHIRQLRDGMKPDQRPGDTTLSFLQEKEIRERLADLEILLLQIKYQEACSEGGPGADLLCAAIENDPMPRLSQEILQEGIIARGQRTSPEQAEKLGHLIRLRAAFKDALGEARAELRKNGLPADDYLTRVAKGEIVPD